MIAAAGCSGVASPDLGGLAAAVGFLPPAVRAAYYAGFLGEPRWPAKDGRAATAPSDEDKE